jgi:integrase
VIHGAGFAALTAFKSSSSASSGTGTRGDTADQIDAYKERLLAAGRLGNRTVVGHLTVLHGIFRRAARVWGLERSPASADLVERPPVRYSGEFRTLCPDEVLHLAWHTDGQQDAALYLTAAFTGLRMGELLALRWHDVDFARQRVQVRRNYTNRAERRPRVDGYARRRWSTR